MGGTIGTAISMVVFVGILGVVGFALFELSPFARHRNVYHKPGERQQCPRLD
jgi:hypothetical protein